jgi:PEGA domain
MTRHWHSLIGIVIAGLTLTGCASIANSGYPGYPISTTPPGAQVLVNGHRFGETPIVLAIDRQSSHAIRIERDGCPVFDTMVSSRLSPWVFGNFILGGPLGLIVDLGHNGGYELHPNSLAVMYAEQNGKCVITGSSLVTVQPGSTPLTPAQTAGVFYSNNASH